MQKMRLGAIESRFADIIWANEPLSSRELVQLCEKELGWKPTTTYTVLKRLSEGGIFQNVKGTVTSQISRRDYYALQSEKFVEDAFEGSLPAFIAAFTTRKAVSPQDIEEIRRIFEAYKEV